MNSSIPARIISAAWWLFCFVTVAMYIGLSMSRTTVPHYKKIFNNLEELVEKSKTNAIGMGALSGGATEAFFKVN